MRIPLSVPYKTRTGDTTKDARLKNAYAEVRGEQSVVRHRPSARGGVAVGSGVAQGGIAINIGGVDSVIGVYGDTLTNYTGGGTSWNAGTAYSIGDHVSVGFVDYWAINDNSNSQPPSADWTDSYVPAVPQPVYATWNPADIDTFSTYSAPVLSNGNLTFSGVGITAPVARGKVRSTVGKSTGKWYWEITRNTSIDMIALGVGVLGTYTLGRNTWNIGDGYSWLYYDGDELPNSFKAGGGLSSNLLYANIACYQNDVIGIALDMDAGQITFFLNGVSLGVAFTGLTGTLYASVDLQNQESTTANFGASAFAYSVPSGYNSGLYT